MFHIQKKMVAGCGDINTACSLVASGNLSCVAEFDVQGKAQSQDKKTCFSKFQRIKEDMADGCKEVKGNIKTSSSLSIVCCRFYRKGEF